jgi:hypothetical protein
MTPLFLCFIERKRDYYENLPKENQLKIRTLVQVLNKFSISLSGYHELSLPRSYLVEGCQKSMDKVWESVLTSTPVPHVGGQVPFKFLLEANICK